MPITHGIANKGFSSKFKGCSPLQLLFNLTGMKPAIPSATLIVIVYDIEQMKFNSQRLSYLKTL